MAVERRGSTSRIRPEKTDEGKEGDGEERKHGSGILSKLGVTRTSKRLSTSGSPSKVEKPAASEPAHATDFHYKGHRPTQEEMVAHLEAFTRSRTPTLESSSPSSAYVSSSVRTPNLI